jgi:membrane associated rhomboid family serine protease
MGPWVARLLIANVVMYVMTASSPAVMRLLMLVPAAVLVRPWTPITYMFLHGSFFHLLFNMLGLYFFGTRLEHRIGSRDFVRLYFFSGLAGAALSFVFSPMSAVIGASGAVFGVLLGFARFWPDEPIYIWGVLPIPAKWLVIIMTMIALYSGYTGAQSGVAHFAHLGGFVGGILYLKWRERGKAKFQQAQRPPRPVLATSTSIVRRWEAIPRERLHEINRAEVDRILAKLKAEGFESLTQTERDYMDRMSL